MTGQNHIESRTRGGGAPQVQWPKANHANGYCLNHHQFNAKTRADQGVSMRNVLRRLQVRFNTNKATQWQRVKCPACASPEAQVLLHGRHGASGGFRCNQCATKGGALVVLARGLNVPVNVARGLL